MVYNGFLTFLWFTNKIINQNLMKSKTYHKSYLTNKSSDLLNISYILLFKYKWIQKRDRILGLITMLLLENILLNQILKKIFLLIDCSVSKNKMLSFDCISYFPSEIFIFSTFCKVQKSNAVTFETISCWFLIHRNKPFKSWNSLKLNNM